MLQATIGLLYLGHVLVGLAVSGLNPLTNLALKKNAIQSSTYTDADIVGLASNAVDGVADGNWTHQSCSHTNEDLPAWWAVDLGKEISVGRVRITNRNIGAERLSNFYIGLTNVSPWTSAPDLATSSICKFSAGYPPAGVPTDFYCDPGTKPGRYLFVLLKDKGFLTICELEAYYIKRRCDHKSEDASDTTDSDIDIDEGYRLKRDEEDDVEAKRAKHVSSKPDKEGCGN